MRFVIEQRQLLKALSSAILPIGKVNSVAILSCYLFEYNHDDGQIYVTGSNDGVAVKMSVSGADIQEVGSGSFCVEARRMMDIVKAMSGIIIVDVSAAVENIVSLSCAEGKSKYKLPMFKGGDYPIRRWVIDAEHKFEISCDVLMGMLDIVSSAVAQDDIHPQVSGVLFDVLEDAVVLVATNKTVLIRSRYDMQNAFTGQYIVPASAVDFLRKIAAKSNAVSVSMSGNSIYFWNEEFMISSSLIQGRYPNYNAVIPPSSSMQCKIAVKEVLSSLGRLSVCSPSSSLLKMRVDGMMLTLTSEDLDFNVGGHEELMCDSNANIEMGLNIGILAQTLKDMQRICENVEVGFCGEVRPVLFTPQGFDAFSLTALIMPMRLD